VPLNPGTRLGLYKIVAPLGAGGMGEVYRAHDTKLERDVAFKILPENVTGDAERRARLLREARTAAALNHPNICTIHEVGEADGRAYIAMELVDGQPLSERIGAGPLPPEEVLRYGGQLAEALAHAHDRGVVHRDLKAANVMITPDRRVKVLDFGLAKRLTSDELTDLTTQFAGPVTGPATIVGTLPYMAPEQLRGHPADERSDVWALGVILYEMAAGTRPFGGQTPYELSSAIFHEAPPPFPPRVHAALQAVTARCLEKDPGRRYQRAGEVRSALETAALGTTPHSARQPAPIASRNRWPLVAAPTMLAVVVGSAVWLNVAGIRQRLFGGSRSQIQSIAVLPLANLSNNPAEEYFVVGMHEALITDLARIGVRKVIAKASADAFKDTKKSPREIGSELGVEALVIGSVMRSSNRVQISAQLVRADSGEVLWANRYERSSGDVLSLQNDIVGAIAREVRATISPEQTARLAAARPVNPAAHDAYLKGRFLYASFNALIDKKLLDGAIAQYDQAIAIDPSYAPPYAALTLAHWTATAIGFLPPKDTFTRARAASLKAVELDDMLAESHAAAALVSLWFDWNWPAALRESERALQLNPNSVDALATYQTYLSLVESKFDEAAVVSQRILTVDPLNPFSRVQAAWIPHYARRYDEATRALRTLLDTYPNNVWAHYFLAMNHGAQGNRAEVRTECRKVMDLLSGTYHIDAIGVCAWALGVVGETVEARRLLERLQHAPAGVWLDPALMGQVHAAVGDIDRAIEWYQKGIDERSIKMIYMKVGPSWDSARGDPRFQALLRQMNFPRSD